ncbi:MAG: hypothetical protein JO234_06800 [Hyphomicrobiales bacterium]|nr:hypothetical protein [Hyphomicrobiales bacterium]
MEETAKAFVACSDCAYWQRWRDQDGTCHRRAPVASAHGEEVAHWPQTRASQGCGDGARKTADRVGAICGECVFWRRPAHGFSPIDRRDMPATWWTHAGHCGRHAPMPASEPGLRAFWPATSSDDGCGEGATRPAPSAEN